MPESEDMLAIAERKLEDARELLTPRLAHLAAREAYLAALAAARAMIFEMDRSSPKTHKGARMAYALLVRARPDLGLPDPVILDAGFNTKQDVDYTGARDVLSPDQAVSNAASFVDAARRVVRHG